MAEVLHRGGGTTWQQAYEAIAAMCAHHGHKTPRGGCEITWKTVRGWRKEALERAPNDDLRAVFDVVADALTEHGGAQGEIISRMVAELSAYQPPKGLGPLALNVDQQER